METSSNYVTIDEYKRNIFSDELVKIRSSHPGSNSRLKTLFARFSLPCVSFLNSSIRMHASFLTLVRCKGACQVRE